MSTVPADLIALELARREQKTRYEASKKLCRYALYRAEKAVADHPWIVERKADWRAARKALKAAADDESRTALLALLEEAAERADSERPTPERT